MFTSGQWQGQAQHAAWNGAFHTASTYYANHTLILRDPAGRTALLDWASSRGITQLCESRGMLYLIRSNASFGWTVLAYLEYL